MAINPRVAARREAEIAFLNEEDERLKDLGEKRKKEAAEKSAAGEKGLYELEPKEFLDKVYDPVKAVTTEPMLFRDEDGEKDEKGPFWYSSFIRNFEAEQARENKENDLLGAKDYGKILERENQKKEEIRKSKENDLPHYDPKEKKYEFRDYYDQKQIFSDSIYDKYLVAEEHAMSEGKNAFENTVKGMFNRLRSAPGEAIEDVAYFLQDNIMDDAPGKGMRWLDDNAEKVVEKNMAGSIGDISTFQFGKAIENGADENLVKIMDEVSKELGYNIFGLSQSVFLQIADIGFKEYKSLRKSGVPKEEALQQSTKKAVFSFIEDKISDIGIKWLNKQLPKGNVYGITADTDDFVDNFDSNNYNRANEKGELVNEFYDLLTDSEWAEYYQKIADNGMLNKPLGYTYVSYEGDMIIFSKRVMTSGTAQDYQIIDCWYVGNDEAYMDVLNLQQKINRGESNYDERRIRQELDRISSKYD